jgi:hypothetical protein
LANDELLNLTGPGVDKRACLAPHATKLEE